MVATVVYLDNFLEDEIVLFFDGLLLAFTIESLSFIMVGVESVDHFDTAVVKSLGGPCVLIHDGGDFLPMLFIVSRIGKGVLGLGHELDEVVIVHGEMNIF